MNAIFLRSLEVELELTFISAPEKCLLGHLDNATILRLTKADLWIEDLIDWIKLVRSDCTFICPELVRQACRFSMGIHLTDDLGIKKINNLWRQKNSATDVLSFPALDETIVLPLDQCVELGDIVVSVPTAQRQAHDHNHLLNYELRWLVSHGFLHLLGWDHPTEQHLNNMLSYQEQLLHINGKVPLNSDQKGGH